jgi:hypothetical protein
VRGGGGAGADMGGRAGAATQGGGPRERPRRCWRRSPRPRRLARGWPLCCRGRCARAAPARGALTASCSCALTARSSSTCCCSAAALPGGAAAVGDVGRLSDDRRAIADDSTDMAPWAGGGAAAAGGVRARQRRAAAQRAAVRRWGCSRCGPLAGQAVPRRFRLARTRRERTSPTRARRTLARAEPRRAGFSDRGAAGPELCERRCGSLPRPARAKCLQGRGRGGRGGRRAAAAGSAGVGVPVGGRGAVPSALWCAHHRRRLDFLHRGVAA